MNNRPLLFGVFLALLSPTVGAADWDSCADDLDRLRRAAADASDAANDVKSAAEEFENCKHYPDMYDHMRDRCRSMRYDYQSALSNLESELSTVDSRVRSVSSSCAIELSSIGSSTLRAPSSGNRKCDLYRSYKNRLPITTLMKTCTQALSEAECNKCLNQ